MIWSFAGRIVLVLHHPLAEEETLLFLKSICSLLLLAERVFQFIDVKFSLLGDECLFGFGSGDSLAAVAEFDR